MPLEYGDVVQPLYSVIIINTILCFIGYFKTNYKIIKVLFFILWFVAGSNQGFMFTKYYYTTRVLDYCIAFLLSNWINFQIITKYLYIFPIFALLSMLIFQWHLSSKDMKTFEFRVNIWHIYVIIILIII